MSDHATLRGGETVVGEADPGPRRVEVGGTSYVVARLGDSVVAARDRCPHRGAPLSAGTIEDGCLVCPYHGWRFGPDGKAVEIPALGPDSHLPPKATLELADVELLGDDLVVVKPSPDPSPGAVLSNDEPGLRRGWHPVCRSGELDIAEQMMVQLLGQTVRLDREVDGTLYVEGAFAVADRLGHIWVAPEPPVADILSVPELEEEGWHHVPMPRVEGRYGVGLLLDNQLDAGHFSFVHRGTFGSNQSAALPAYELQRRPWGFETSFAVPISARNDVAALQGERPLGQHRSMFYRYQAPTGLWLQLDYEEMGGSTGILFCFTPLSATQTRMDVDLYFRRRGGFTADELAERLEFEIQVLGEDMALQDQFESTAMPLEVTAEVHTKADKAAVEMRRILGRLLSRVPST